MLGYFKHKIVFRVPTNPSSTPKFQDSELKMAVGPVTLCHTLTLFFLPYLFFLAEALASFVGLFRNAW